MIEGVFGELGSVLALFIIHEHIIVEKCDYAKST